MVRQQSSVTGCGCVQFCGGNGKHRDVAERHSWNWEFVRDWLATRLVADAALGTSLGPKPHREGFGPSEVPLYRTKSRVPQRSRLDVHRPSSGPPKNTAWGGIENCDLREVAREP